MAQKILPKILTIKSLVLLLICLAVILGFILMVIYPDSKALARQDLKIKELKTRIKQQELLTPLYEDLKALARFKAPIGLPMPKRESLVRGEVGRLSMTFQEMAKNSNLEVDSVVAQVRQLENGSDLLGMDVSAKGDFFDFRGFLIQLAGLPYLEHIERVQIQSARNPKSLKLRIWLLLE